MAQIDQIVSVSIQASAQTPQIPNFGIPAILCYHTHNTDFIRTYSSLAGLVADGFSTTEPAYLMAQSMLEQNPTVSSFKVIRGSTSVQQVMTFKVTDTTNGDTVGLVLADASGVTHAVQHVNSGSQTAIQIATALAGISVTGATLSSGGTDTVTITITASGAVWFPSSITGGTFTDTTPTANPATDLTNALNTDSSWYGFAGEHCDATNIQARAVWAEANKRLHYYVTADTNNLSASSGIGHTLNLAAYQYSFGIYSGTPGEFGGCAAMANEFVRDPGTYTMAFKALTGVAVDALSDNQVTNLVGNKLNYYMQVNGVNILRDGVCASGIYVDLRRGIDALAAQIQFNIYDLLVTTPKVSYDPFGIAMVGAEVRSALAQFSAASGKPAALLRSDPGFKATVTLPDISTVNATDRANRVLKNVSFTAYAQNAVQTVQVQGVVNQ